MIYMKKLFIFFGIVVISIYAFFFLKKDSHIFNQKYSVASLIDVAKNNNVMNIHLGNVIEPFQARILPGVHVVSDALHVTSPIILTKENILARTNDNRKANGNLSALTENSELDRSADIKLKDMFAKQYFEHMSPTKIGVSDLANEVSYQYVLIGENLAMGDFFNEKDLLDAWMASPGHRANILNTHYREIGVAVGRGIYQGKDVWMAVQHFGTPKSSCPSIDESLHTGILDDQNFIQSMSTEIDHQRIKIDSGGVTNEQILVFNSLVENYNNLVRKVKDNIATYNEQVQAFNACITNMENPSKQKD